MFMGEKLKNRKKIEKIKQGYPCFLLSQEDVNLFSCCIYMYIHRYGYLGTLKLIHLSHGVFKIYVFI